MSQVIYQTEIVSIGEFAEASLEEGVIITFKEGASSDLSDYCFILRHGALEQPIQAGQILSLGSIEYKITAVGDVVNKNLKELGHITIRFSGDPVAELPGSVHVDGKTPEKVVVGDKIIITSR